MPTHIFRTLIILLGVGFAVAFSVIVIPPLIASGDVIGAFAAGFVNPYSSGYSLDTILCGLILMVWAIYERSALGVRHGLWVIPLSLVPGVATAFAYYLIIRLNQQTKSTA